MNLINQIYRLSDHIGSLVPLILLFLSVQHLTEVKSGTVTQAIFEEEIVSYWFKVYDANCENVLGETGYVNNGKTICVILSVDKNVALIGEGGIVYYYVKGKTLKFFSVGTFDVSTSFRSTLMSYPDFHFNFTSPTLKELVVQNMDTLAYYPLCGARSMVSSGIGLTKFDCCKDPTLITCIPFTNLDFSGLGDSETRCVSSYFGYGSVYNTPCERYYQSESPFYTPSLPTGNGYHNYGNSPKTIKFGCYLENWSKWRKESWGYPYFHNDSYAGCDALFYAFQDGHTMNGPFEWRETHDVEYIKHAVSSGLPVYITIGGWNAFGSEELSAKVFFFFVQRRQQTLTDILTWGTTLGIAGVDIDIEWTNSRGMEKQNHTALLENIHLLCKDLNTNGLECHFGVQPLSKQYDIAYYKKVLPVATTFNMFGYDFAGCFDPEHPGDQSQWDNKAFSMVNSITNLKLIVPADKISVGFPVYSRGYTIEGDYATSFTVNKKLPCAPLADISSMLVEGMEVLVQDKSGKVFPRACSVDYRPSTVAKVEIFPNKDNEDLTKVCQFTLKNGTKGLMYYMDETSVYEYAKRLHDKYSITNFFTYAYSMFPAVSNLFSIMTKSAVKSKVKRSITPAYFFPSSFNSGPVSCPTIVFYSKQIVVTTSIYQGCVRSGNGYCYYQTSKFSCAKSDVSRVPITVYKYCDGVDVTTLLPSNSKSKRVMCPDLTLYMAAKTVCSTPHILAKRNKTIIVPTGFRSTFRPMYKRKMALPVVNVSAIYIPNLCTKFLKPLSCIEFMCGTDSKCVSTLKNSSYTTFCTETGDVLNDYDISVKDVIRTHKLMIDSLQDLVKAASKSKPNLEGEDMKIKSKNGPDPLLGVLAAAGVINMFMGFGNSERISKLAGRVDLLEQNQQILDNRVTNVENRMTNAENLIKDVGNQVQEVSKSVANLATQTNTRFGLVDNQMNVISGRVNDITNTMNTNFANQGNLINKLNSRIVDVDKRFKEFAKLTSLSMRYVIFLQSLTQKIALYRNDLQFVIDRLQSCISSLLTGSAQACTSSDGITVPLDTHVVNTTDGLVVLITYLEQKVEADILYYTAGSYCANNTLFVAAAGCSFILRNGTVYHMDDDLNYCPHPYISYGAVCLPDFTSIKFPTNYLNVRPVGSNITVKSQADPFDYDKIKKDLDDELTRKIMNLTITLNVTTPTPLPTNFSSSSEEWQKMLKEVEKLKNYTFKFSVPDPIPFDFKTRTNQTFSFIYIVLIIYTACFCGFLIYYFKFRNRRGSKQPPKSYEKEPDLTGLEYNPDQAKAKPPNYSLSRPPKLFGRSKLN